MKRSDSTGAGWTGVLIVAVLFLLAGCLGGGGGAGGGDGAAGPPDTSFEASEEEVTYQDRDYRDWCGNAPTNADDDARVGGACFNGTEVLIEHAGGASLSASNTEILVNGNASVWGTTNPASDAEGTGEEAWDIDTEEHIVQPVPNFLADGQFGSGDTWRVSVYGGPIENAKDWHNPVWPDEAVKEDQYWVSFIHDDARPDLWQIRPREVDMEPNKVNAKTLESGDEIEVVWQAQSGEDTETLFTYTMS